MPQRPTSVSGHDHPGNHIGDSCRGARLGRAAYGPAIRTEEPAASVLGEGCRQETRGVARGSAHLRGYPWSRVPTRPYDSEATVDSPQPSHGTIELCRTR